jgi:hypothetical protein
MNATLLKILLATVFFTVIGSAYQASADYAVVLKNNRKFTASHYWEENNELKFRLGNGVIGIRKDHIKQIETVNLDLASVPSQVETKTHTPTEPADTLASDVDPHRPQAGTVEPGNSEVIDPSLAQELPRLKERFGDVERLSNSERQELAGDLFSFRKRLLARVSEGGLTSSYGDLLRQVTAMESRIDALLVSRSR